MKENILLPPDYPLAFLSPPIKLFGLVMHVYRLYWKFLRLQW